MKDRLRRKLLYLRESHNIVGVKGGTEVEDMSFEELSILREISKDIVPMIVKIGGPEARNDIRQCIKIGVDGILAPMIESDYSFINFIETIKEITGNNIASLYLAINLETITGYFNINQIMNHILFSHIHQVTIGRTDLAGSMEYTVNQKEVMDVTLDIVERVKKMDKLTSVGGKIDALSAQKIKDYINPHRINTRHISIDIRKTKNLTFSICEALSFEIELYKLLMNIDSEKQNSYIKRIEDTKRRIGKREAAFLPTIGLAV